MKRTIIGFAIATAFLGAAIASCAPTTWLEQTRPESGALGGPASAKRRKRPPRPVRQSYKSVIL